MKKLIVFLSVFVFFRVNGQETIKQEAEIKYKHAVGACAGFTIGYGLAYKYMPLKYGIQLSFAPYHDQQVDQYSSGLTIYYLLIESKKSNLFLYQGNHYFYRAEPKYYLFPTDSKDKVATKYFNNGIGIGIDFILLTRISFNLMIGYGAYKNFESLNLTGETGVYYRL